MQLLLYFPAITIEFAGFEDFQFLEIGWSSFMRNPNIPIQVDVGRPLGAFILGLYAGLVNVILDLNVLRFLSAIIMGLSQAFLCIFVLRAGLNIAVAFGISTIIFTTATASSIGQWAAASQMPFAIFFAFLAAECSLRAVAVKLKYHSNREISLLKSYKGKWFLFAFTFLIMSFLTYPVLALFYAVPFVAYALYFNNDADEILLKELLSFSMALFSFTYVFYFFVTKLIYFPLLRYLFPEHLGNPIYNFEIHTNIIARFGWFVSEAFPRFVKIFSLPNGMDDSFILLILLVGGLAFSFNILKDYKHSISKNNVNILYWRTLSLLLFFFLVNAHLFFAKSVTLAPRIYASSQAIIILFLFAGIIQILHLLSKKKCAPHLVVIVSLISFTSLITAKYSIETTALNQFLELRYLTAEIKRQYSPSVQNIAVVQVPQRSMYVGFDIKGYNWVNSDVVGSMIPAMVSQALKYLQINDRYVKGLGLDKVAEEVGKKGITITPMKPNSTGYIEVGSSQGIVADSLKVIDMRRLLFVGNNDSDLNLSSNDISITQIYTSDKKELGYRYGPVSAMMPDNRNIDRFWETGMLPVSLGFILDIPKRLKSYSLGGEVEAIGRMPVAWRLEGLGKDKSWTLLDDRNNVSWLNSEKKEFFVNTSQSYNQYRLSFIESSEGILRIYNIKLNFIERS